MSDKAYIKYRIYGDGTYVWEDDFALYDEGGEEPFTDDYEEFSLTEEQFFSMEDAINEIIEYLNEDGDYEDT